MRRNKRMIASIIEIAIGIVLLISNFGGSIDEYWSGMGTGLIVIGVIQLARQIKYKTNITYRETVDVVVNDERNKYIGMKAWSWAGYLFVFVAAVSSVILKIIGYEELVPIASGSVCLIVILYWISFLYLRRKY